MHVSFRRRDVISSSDILGRLITLRKAGSRDWRIFRKWELRHSFMVMAAKMIKAGYRVAYAANSRVIHSHNYTGIQQFKRNFDLAVSQTDHPEVFAGIRSESEGIRMVKNTAGYLIRRGKLHLLPTLLYKSVCKYMGYKAGQKYRKMPLWMVKKCTASKAYWEKSPEINIYN